MSVRWRILALGLACFAFIVAMVIALIFAMRTAEQFVRRVDGLQARFEVIAGLDGSASRYAAQVARAFLADGVAGPQLQQSRLEMVTALAELARVTRAEIATLRGIDEVQIELPEIENARRITEVYHSVDAAVTRALALARAGSREAAMTLYRREAEFRLTNELQTLISRELNDEREELARESGVVDETQSLLIVIALIGAGLAMAAIIALAFTLYRGLTIPLERLVVAARGLAAGRFEQQLTLRGTNEFAAIAAALNQTAATLGTQQSDMQQSGARLSAEVEARTRELSEANARLRSLDSRRAQFLADVSHQLRTPLTILRGEADVSLRGQPDATEQRQALLRIKEQAVELGGLLEDLLSFARSDAESAQHLPEPLALEQVVNAAVQEAAVLAEPREIAIELRLGDGGAKVDADFRRLKQALLIGLDNAVKHSPPGGRIEVETRRDDDGVHVAIMDQGPGIADKDRPHVFERFYRAESEDELQNAGLGIGLAIAREIVDRHGGHIALDNRATGGAVLEIVLPLHVKGSPA